ncbi:hypothetical protein BGW38_006133 [Lunasporangiospora selenospora]|uniref:Uncharacterized protein n=1 Tax=Lunasporangiospora selenospora TaxID=979761 RepID=A0A9P6KAG8_9FUNG|nr:hypothetical protein BGW38_006133 [Lunasporangiospora selenospora]
MSDGNLRFKCRPPVSMSLICNKSYSESKIRNMIAGVVYGHSLPDVATPTSASSPGENILALAPPPMPAKPSRRASHKNDSSPRLVSDLSSERHARHYDELENDRSENGMHHHHHHHHQGKEHASLQRHSGDSDGHGDETRLPHPLDARRGSHVVQQSPMHSHHQVGRRASIQPARRASLIGEDAGIMDYDDAMMNSQGGHAGQLQIPGTPPLDSDDPRLYRSRSTFMHSARSVTPTGHPSSGSSRPSQKLHHSHSHPNIGQARHQHFLEQQEREHRGSIANIGAANQQYHPQPSSSQQQPAQRQIPRQMSRRESTQHLGGHMERRASYAALQATSPGGPGLNGSSKYGSSSGHMGDALSPALSSSPRSSPGRETFPPHMNSGPTSEHGHTGTSLMRSSSSTSRYDEGANLPPPPVSSGLSHAYDRRPSELDEYPRSHREKYEKLNASTHLSPSSRSQQRMKSYHGHPHQGHHPLQGDASPGGMEGRSGHLHPVDQVVSDDGGAKQAMTPPMRSHHGAPTSPWMHSTASSGHGAADQSSKYAQAGHMNGGSRHGSFRQQPSSAGSGYYQQPRHEDKDRYDTDNDGRDMSPDYTDMDVDGRK